MNETTIPADIFAACPAVCAIGDEYQIMVPVLKSTVMWCEVDGKNFYDDSNGILRSETAVHRMTVPQKLLNKAGKYTIHYREIHERLAYFSKLGDDISVPFAFRGIDENAEKVRIYHISDTHNRVENPAKAGSYWGDTLDLLIMNGDIPDHCGAIENMGTVYQVAGKITKGGIPMIFSRGNHDLRGVLAEKYAENTPSRNGKTYYTFRLGPVWGLVLDCGEDKPDEHEAYGGTICCHDFRLRQTEYIREIIAGAADEYEAEGVGLKLVIAHYPFNIRLPDPFFIEEDIYSEWIDLLKTHIKPDAMVCGHMHDAYVMREDHPQNAITPPCPVIIGSEVERPRALFGGCALEWTPEKLKILFTDQDLKVFGEDEIPLG